MGQPLPHGHWIRPCVGGHHAIIIAGAAHPTPHPHTTTHLACASTSTSCAAAKKTCSTGGGDARRAAEAIASMGTHHDIYCVQGGFRAWQVAGWPGGVCVWGTID